MEITKASFKRLIKDYKDIIKEPLHDNGIYYIHSESNILKGYALIIGPKDTPYQYGNYFFEIDYPNDYPFNPPKLTFLTNYDGIRMNPNLYRSGKVCISILNTWRGEQWSSCQSIKTILLTLTTILINNPLLNEPGVHETHKDFNAYNEIITFKNIDISIFKVLKNEIIPKDIYEMFKDICIKNFLNNYSKIIDVISENKKNNGLIRTNIYNMNVKIDYNNIENNIKKLKQNLNI